MRNLSMQYIDIVIIINARKSYPMFILTNVQRELANTNFVISEGNGIGLSGKVNMNMRIEYPHFRICYINIIFNTDKRV